MSEKQNPASIVGPMMAVAIALLVFVFVFSSVGNVIGDSAAESGTTDAEEMSESIENLSSIFGNMALALGALLGVGSLLLRVEWTPKIKRFDRWLKEGSQKKGPLPDWLQPIYDYIVEPLDFDDAEDRAGE